MPNRRDRRKAAAKARKAATIQARQAIKAKPLTLTAAVDLRAAEGDAEPKSFEIVAYTGEPLVIEGFNLPVVVDMASLDLSAQRIPVLYDHMPGEEFIIGQTNQLIVENGKLTARGGLILTDAPDERNYARRVVAKAQAGFMWQASIGGNPAAIQKVEAGKTGKSNGRDYPGPCYIAHGTEIREISFVVIGADRRTSAVVARKRRIKGAAMSFEQWLLSMGFEDAAGLSEVQRANLEQVYQTENPEGDTGGDAVDTMAGAAGEGEDAMDPEEETPPTQARARRPVVQARRAAPDIAARMRRDAAAEINRQDAIRLRAAKHDVTEIEIGEGDKKRKVNLVAHAIAENWTADRTELEAMRAARPSGPDIISRNHDRDCTIDALQCATILRAGGKLDHPSYQTQGAIALKIPPALRLNINAESRQRAMEAAHKYSDMSMVDICREAIRIDGKSLPTERREIIRAAFSGSALANIFTTNVNAILLASYMEVGDTTQGWTSSVDVADFKTNERPRVEVGPGLTIHPRGATAEHANYVDLVESYKIHRFSRQFVVDEQDIIDDSMGAISDTPRRLGEAAGWVRPDMVYYILLANPTLGATSTALFHADQDQGTGNGNLDTSSALTEATLKAGLSRMSLFTENSRNLNLQATHLIVPPTLNWDARQLIESAVMLFGGDDETRRGDKNVMQGAVQVISEARIENGCTDPITGTAGTGANNDWYLASTMAHTIEVAYLRGTGRVPQVRNFQLDRGQWGFGWDVKLDIGAKELDWRGLYKGEG